MNQKLLQVKGLILHRKFSRKLRGFEAANKVVDFRRSFRDQPLLLFFRKGGNLSEVNTQRDPVCHKDFLPPLW